MIIRCGLASLRTPGTQHLLPVASRTLSTSPARDALSRKDASKGSRHSRVTRRAPREREHRDLEELTPEVTRPPPSAHAAPPTPPWPTTSSPGGGKAFPWRGYNDGPVPPELSQNPATGVAAPAAVEVTAERPPIATLPVEVPRDELGVLDNATGDWSDKARALLTVPAIVVTRQLEMMNLFLGYEEANKYQLLSPNGDLLGYLMEEDLGLRSSITRQILKTHRAFKATVLDTEGNVLLRIRRPFSWINSRIYVSTPSPTDSEADETVIGEAQQEFHVWRRRYNVFIRRDGVMEQFGETDSGLLAWDFWVRDQSGATIGSISRNFAGLGRELFTDTGVYVVRFEGVVDELLDPAIASPPAPDALPSPSQSASTSLTSEISRDSPKHDMTKMPDANPTATPTDVTSVPATISLPSITFDQRAVMLASAVSIDFDYFTRSRGGIGSSMMWMPMPMGGTGSTDAGVVGAEAGAVGGEMGDEPLPSSGSEPYENEGPDDGVSRGGEESYGSGGWTDAPIEDPEVMVDPWAQSPSSGEDGGTWSWGDLFPDE